MNNCTWAIIAVFVLTFTLSIWRGIAGDLDNRN